MMYFITHITRGPLTCGTFSTARYDNHLHLIETINVFQILYLYVVVLYSLFVKIVGCIMQ